MERGEIEQFLQKLRQKLKCRDQIENEKMTPDIILTCDIVISMSLCHGYMTRCQLNTWQLFFLIQKIKKSKNNLKNLGTDIQYPFNGVTLPIISL